MRYFDYADAQFPATETGALFLSTRVLRTNLQTVQICANPMHKCSTAAPTPPPGRRLLTTSELGENLSVDEVETTAKVSPNPKTGALSVEETIKHGAFKEPSGLVDGPIDEAPGPILNDIRGQVELERSSTKRRTRVWSSTQRWG